MTQDDTSLFLALLVELQIKIQYNTIYSDIYILMCVQNQAHSHPQNSNLQCVIAYFKIHGPTSFEARNEDSTKLQSSFQKPLCLRIQITIRYESAGHYPQ